MSVLGFLPPWVPTSISKCSPGTTSALADLLPASSTRPAIVVPLPPLGPRAAAAPLSASSVVLPAPPALGLGGGGLQDLLLRLGVLGLGLAGGSLGSARTTLAGVIVAVAVCKSSKRVGHGRLVGEIRYVQVK